MCNEQYKFGNSKKCNNISHCPKNKRNDVTNAKNSVGVFFFSLQKKMLRSTINLYNVKCILLEAIFREWSIMCQFKQTPWNLKFCFS